MRKHVVLRDGPRAGHRQLWNGKREMYLPGLDSGYFLLAYDVVVESHQDDASAFCKAVHSNGEWHVWRSE